jgi:hypothetical protein
MLILRTKKYNKQKQVIPRKPFGIKYLKTSTII